MTKNELYSFIVSAGVKLPPINKLSKADLEAKYSELHPVDEEEKNPPEHDEFPPLDVLEKTDAESAQAEDVKDSAPPMLFFDHAGWCDKIGGSYYMGWYQPRSWNEYNALKKYAVEG